jgi:uncharacterized protein
MQTCRAVVLCLSAFFLLVLGAPAQTASAAESGTAVRRDIDPQILQVIQSTAALDNHAHPVLAPPADTTDREFDALPVDNMAPQTDPVAWRADWPVLHDAWLALYGVDLKAPLDAETTKQLDAARAQAKTREGAGYSAWVLDKSGIGTMVANRVAMGTGVQPPRFLWVPYDDALLFPLDNAKLKAETPDRAQFFPLEETLRARYLRESGVAAMPKTLDEYIARVVLPTLQRQKRGGAIAVKFELAYLRALDIGNPTHEQASLVYTAGGAPMPSVYKTVQDYLFRAIAVECGRLGMAVHLHGMAGAGSYFSQAGVNPLNLEPLLNDPALRKTNFVLLHGGWPYVREAGALLQKPNFYLDLSQQAILIPARTLSTWLREWLEMYPEKVLFATDGYPYSPAMGWEEATWVAARNAREALGLALTGMLRDGEITAPRAEELARMVLRGNAEALYGIKAAH